MTRQRDRSESGVSAVLVSILVMAVFIPLAALAVDLGNAWARGRAVQRQADLSAIGAGYLLPMSTASGHTSSDIAGKVAELLNQNLAPGQDPSNVGNPVSAAQLLNGTVADGEVQFFSDASMSATCTASCPVMRVVPPPARVQFAFAVAFTGGGTSGTDVQRDAVVEAESELPDPRKVLPFWLPNGCGYGAAQADVSNGGGPQGGPMAPQVGTLPGGGAAVLTGYSPSPLDTRVSLTGSPGFLTSDASTIDLTKWSLSAPGNYADNATIVVYDALGSRVATYASARPSTSPKTTYWSPSQGSIKAADLGDVSGIYVAFLEIKDNQDKLAYSTTGITITVSGVSPSASPTAASPSPSPTATTSPSPAAPTASSSTDVGCLGADRGNFGQLDSPRAGVTGRQTRLGLNIARGLDHQLAPFVWGSTQTPVKDCGKKTSPISGAYQDTDPISDPPRNCIQGDTGNDGPWLYHGFVDGLNGVVGRFNATNGTTDCAGKRTDVTEDGVQLNNDTLSCYLRNGHVLADIAQSSGVDTTMLDPAVLNSPRFVWLPVVVATDRAQKDFQPIYDFVPAFVTDEATTSTSDPAAFNSPHDINGLEMNGGSSVKVLHIFVFNKSALPVDEQSPSMHYLAQVGRAEVRLVG